MTDYERGFAAGVEDTIRRLAEVGIDAREWLALRPPPVPSPHTNDDWCGDPKCMGACSASSPKEDAPRTVRVIAEYDPATLTPEKVAEVETLLVEANACNPRSPASDSAPRCEACGGDGRCACGHDRCPESCPSCAGTGRATTGGERE